MKLIYTLFLLLISSLIFAVSGNPDKSLQLKKTDTEIIIDGLIDKVWETADSTDSFVQHSPHHNSNPSKRTVAKLLTDETSLYCLIKCYDDYDNIEIQTGTLDEFAGDIVSIMLDTFNDSRTAYKFAVTASGVRGDSRMLDDARNRDYSWDGIWFADSKIYNWGYAVEIRIPYKSIQYNQELNSWGLDFDRWIANSTEDIYWCEYDENEGQRISKFGKLVFNDFRPNVKGLNLEVYPVGISKITKLENDKYKVDPNAGLDIFYNPSPELSFQFTANPDFAQIEADPFDFNISRYESYFSERRPFFTEGQEVFQAAGRDRNSGFYRPMELLYSRRIGKKLNDGQEVPLIAGSKAFGRSNDWEYGGFAAITGEKKYYDSDDEMNKVEERAYFGSVRLKKQIMDNSSIGFMFVGKQDRNGNNGVLDIDGAFRGSDWQLAYQLARSFKDSQGDFALSAGFTNFKQEWMTLARTRYVGDKFDIDEVGYVPWQGSSNTVALTGPRWYYNDGPVRAILLYVGGYAGWEKVDNYWDYGGLIGYNMNFRSQWGFEINVDAGKAKDEGVKYSAYNIQLSSWFHTSPKWNGNLYGGYSRTYNFSREYLAYYSWMGTSFSWKASSVLSLGTDYNMYIEGNPEGGVEDITYNARPFFSLTPINDLNIKMYVDNVFVKSSDRMEQVILGFFFAYNFSPKSWIYFAFNEIQDRSDEYNIGGTLLPNRIHTVNRAAVLKLKYLYYL